MEENKPKTFWVLMNRRTGEFYAEAKHLKFGTIQTVCTDVKVAKRFSTRKMAEKKIGGAYANFTAESVYYIPKDYHLGNSAKVVIVDDVIAPKKKQTKKDIEILKLQNEILSLRYERMTLLSDKIEMLRNLEKEFRILFRNDHTTLHTIIEALVDMERRLVEKYK